MITELKSEFRKLLTVRSTYLITLFTIVLIAFVGFYVVGWRLTGGDLRNPFLLASDITDPLTNLVFLAGVVGVLLMTHEYRYNTIVYTLTASNSRSKVLLAKVIATSAYAIFFTILVAVLSPLMTYLGVHAHGHALVPQTLNLSDLAWRALYYGWGYAMIALMIAVIVRNQVATIVALFLTPAVEQLLSLLLKNNTVYLPFDALGSLMQKPLHGAITHARAAEVFALYLIVGWAIAWLLFLRRDAS